MHLLEIFLIYGLPHHGRPHEAFGFRAGDRALIFPPRPAASFIPAQGKAASAAAALGLVRKRSTQPEGLPHPPPQTPRSIVNQRGFSIRCSLLGGPHQPLLSPEVADLRGSQISSMGDLSMFPQLKTLIVRPDQLSQEEKNRLRPQVRIE